MDAVARHYIRHFRERAAEELASFKEEASFESAVRRASNAETPDGRRYSHQRRRRQNALVQAEAKLMARIGDLQTAESFPKLHEVIDITVRNIKDIGDLYIYDTALRIGANRDLKPSRVYLHSGTRDGAKALGLEWKRDCLDLFDFPELRKHLAAHEIEDVLCIYKRYFTGERELEEQDSCWSDDDFSGC
jgi:ABC-type Fe3+/spermidine/putrescine transport system ATPase subunit